MFLYVENLRLILFMKNILSRIFKKEQNTPIFLNLHSIETLLYVDFLEIIKSDKKELLDKEYSKEKKYFESDLKIFEEHWVKIQDEIYLLENNQESKALINKSCQRLVLVEKMKLIERDTNLLIWLVNKREVYYLANELEEYEKQVQSLYQMIMKHDSRIKLKVLGTVEENLKTLERVILSFVNEYNTKHKDIESKVEKANTSVFYNVLQVNRITGLQLNAMTMVCAEWFEAKKIAIEMNKQQPKFKENE